MDLFEFEASMIYRAVRYYIEKPGFEGEKKASKQANNNKQTTNQKQTTREVKKIFETRTNPRVTSPKNLYLRIKILKCYLN